jgi:hypothetical protein
MAPDNPFSKKSGWKSVWISANGIKCEQGKQLDCALNTYWATELDILQTPYSLFSETMRAISGSPDGELMYKSNDRAEFEAREYVKAGRKPSLVRYLAATIKHIRGTKCKSYL